MIREDAARRALLRGLLMTWALCCAAVPNAALAADTPSPLTVSGEPIALNVPGDGQDARGLRWSLLGLLGLALGCGVFVQYHTIASTPRAGGPAPRPTAPAAPTVLEGDAKPGIPPPPAWQPPTAARPSASPPLPAWLSPVPARPFTSPPSPRRVAPTAPAPQLLHHAPSHAPHHTIAAPPPTPAMRACANAVAAAHRYDRPATRAAFVEAFAADPGARPSALPGFWEMPPGGHADLAGAYLRLGMRLDARSVLSLALLASPHHRELTALLQTIAPHAIEETA